MTRSLVSLEIRGRDLIGTAHEPRNPGPERLGVLLLNAGPAPRAGNSDLSARLGDHLAERGAYCFRFDLPGLGDSEGEIPERIAAFWREVQRGRNDLPALDLGRRLRAAYRLRGLAAGGLCAGAVTALRAADRDPAVFSGLLLLEPSFRVEPEFRPRRPSGPSPLRRALLYLAGDAPAARALRPLRPFFRRWLELEGGHALPPELDPELVEAWLRTLRRRLPTFLALAVAPEREHPCGRILSGLPPYRRGAVTIAAVEGSNHLFTWGGGRDAVIRAAGRWVTRP